MFENKAEFVRIDEKYLYWIKVKRSKSPVYLKKDEKGNEVSEVWIRAQGSSNKITKAEELQKFFKQFELINSIWRASIVMFFRLFQ